MLVPQRPLGLHLFAYVFDLASLSPLASSVTHANFNIDLFLRYQNYSTDGQTIKFFITILLNNWICLYGVHVVLARPTPALFWFSNALKILALSFMMPDKSYRPYIVIYYAY